jgi:hypothetical protein
MHPRGMLLLSRVECTREHCPAIAQAFIALTSRSEGVASFSWAREMASAYFRRKWDRSPSNAPAHAILNKLHNSSRLFWKGTVGWVTREQPRLKRGGGGQRHKACWAPHCRLVRYAQMRA